MANFNKILFQAILALFATSGFAQGFYFQPIIKHRLSGGAVFSFFGKDPTVAKNIRPLFGFTVNYTSEIELVDNTSALAGLTYSNQAVQFNGYYVAPGHTYLFDETFAYTHRLRFQSIQLPLAIKFNCNLEADNDYTPYFIVGLGFSYLYNAKVSIKSDSTGNRIYKGRTDFGFENHIINKKFNTFVEGGFGLQKNLRKKDKALFLEFLYKFDISRLSYTGHDNSNNVHFRNSSVSATAGMKF